MHRVGHIGYWVLVLWLFGVSAFFAYRVNRHRASLAGSPNPLCLKGGDVVTVTRVVDGDELFVSKPSCTAIVRILGVKSFDPVKSEKDLQVYARGAIGALRRLEGTRVTLVATGFTIDSSRRVVATVTQDTRDVGLALVAEGLALVYRKYPFALQATYLAAEAEARAHRSGLWSSDRASARAEALQKAWTREAKR